MIKEVVVDLPIEGSLMHDAVYIKCIIENGIEGELVVLDFLQDEKFKEYLQENTPELEAWDKLLAYIATL